jgi:hypothetical protein
MNGKSSVLRAGAIRTSLRKSYDFFSWSLDELPAYQLFPQGREIYSK